MHIHVCVRVYVPPQVVIKEFSLCDWGDLARFANEMKRHVQLGDSEHCVPLLAAGLDLKAGRGVLVQTKMDTDMEAM